MWFAGTTVAVAVAVVCVLVIGAAAITGAVVYVQFQIT